MYVLRKKLFIILILISLYFLYSYSNSNVPSYELTSNNNFNLLSYELASWRVKLEGIDNFIVEDTREIFIKNSKITDLTTTSNDSILMFRRIDNSNASFANVYIDDQKIKLISVYDPAISPYFAILTTKIVCPERFQPIYNEINTDSTSIEYYIVYANERLGYGVCTDDLIKYREIIAFAYCENTESLYEIEYFVPNEKYDENSENLIKSFSCLF